MKRVRLPRGGVIAFAIALSVPATLARGEEPPAPSAPADYAGKPAAWWLRELAVPRTSAVAKEALRLLGEEAFPDILRALAGEDSRLREAVAKEIDAFPGDPTGFLPLVEESLRSGSPHVRLAAARLAKRTGTRGLSLFKALVEAGADTSAEIRAAVVQAIVAIGSRSPESYTVLVRGLRNTDADASRAARDAFEKVGLDEASAVPAITAGLAWSPAANTDVLIPALGRIGADVPGVLEALRAARERGGRTARLAAVQALALCASRSPAGLAEFKKMLEPGGPDREAALREGGAFPEVLRATLPDFLQALSDEESRIGAAAGGALMKWKGPVDDWVPLLFKAHVRPEVGGHFVGILRAWGTRALPAAAEAYSSASPVSQKVLWMFFMEIARSTQAGVLSPHAAKLLPTLRTRILAADAPVDERRGHVALLAVFAESDPTSALAFVEFLDEVGDATLVTRVVHRVPAVRGALLERLLDERAPVRRRALDLLAGFLGPAEAPVLGRLLTDSEPDLRARAALALMRGQGPFDRRRNPPELLVPAARLVAALSDALRDKDAQIRAQAARSLGSLGENAKDALPLLVSALSDQDSAVWTAAAEALARLSIELQIPLDAVLAPAVDSPDGFTRAAAARALTKAGGHVADVIALLRPLLDHAEARVRAAALDAVGVLGRDAGGLAARVDALQKDADPKVAHAARAAMASLHR